ncbi:MAG: rhomboid family intramembrane serine protease [Leptolyngbya sp.]|nr:rhomboid family intramembrane serine protease [Leptolyngbya sp.]
MVPLRDDNPTHGTPVVVYGILGLNLAVFLVQIGLSPQGLDQVYHTWGMVPAQITASLRGQLETPLYAWITLLSSQFLHGGFFHIGGNLLYLWIFGNNIEDQLGHVRFLIFYLGCGVLAGLTQWAFDPTSTVPTVGASGAIAGVMGAYILRFPRAQILVLLPLIVLFTTVRIPAILFLGLWFAQQALFSLAALSDQVNLGAIAYWAHSGGFAFGLILGPMLGLMKSQPPR